MTQWTSVDEDMPDVGQQVIVARENGDVTVATYEALRNRDTMVYLWVESGSLFNWKMNDVLSWQPLPDHPDTLVEVLFDKLEDYGYMDPDEFSE